MKKSICRCFLLIICCFGSVQAQYNSEVGNSSVICIPVVADQPYSFLLDTVGTWLNQVTCPMTWGLGAGEEVLLRFTAPCTNTFAMVVTQWHHQHLYPIGIRTSTGNCTPGGFTCMTPVNVVSSYPQYILTYEVSVSVGVTYDILIEFDYDGYYMPASLGVQIKTPHASNIGFQNVTPDSLDVKWTGVFDEVVLEYGPKDFIPGTDTISGPLGTVLIGVNSPVTIAGLVNDQVYDFYLRDRCGSVFSGNSTKRAVRIPKPDSLYTLFQGCSNFNFIGTIYGYNLQYPCSWNNITCGGCTPTAPEIIKKFIPDTSGYHIFSKLNQGSTSPAYQIFYKEAALGIDEKNWQCIGDGLQNTPWSHSFGPLNAGTPYYLMVKATQDNCNSVGGITSATFSVDCPGGCPIISNHSINNISYTTVTFLMRQGNTLGQFYIEYGLAGFTPGNDSLPGVGGTILTTFPYVNQVIYGLLPGTQYDFYFRQYCNISNAFSANSSKRTVTTLTYCSLPSVAITSNRPGDAVCKGQSIILTQNGGLLSPGAQYYWYKDSCNTPPIGTGNSISITPDSSGYYFVRPLDTCSTVACVSIFITVNELPEVVLLNDSTYNICFGDTVELSATVNPNWSYQWLRNGNPIGAISQPIYSASIAGSYSVRVVDLNLCEDTSLKSRVNIICQPPLNPEERTLNSQNVPQNGLEFFPNPFSEKLFIKMDLNSDIHIRITTIEGVAVWEDEFTYSLIKYIDSSEWSKGIYLVHIRSIERKWVYKIIKS